MSENRKPIVSIVMGSRSDLPTMEACFNQLKEFDIPFEAHALSAHRTPDEVIKMCIRDSKEDHPKDEEPYIRINSDFGEDKVSFIKKVKDTNTFVGITSPLSDDEAVKAFSYLSFEKHQ